MTERIRFLYLRYKEILRYVIVGGMTTIVSLSSYWICVSAFLDASDALQLQAANVISWICAVSFAYTANRHYVFESRESNRISEAVKFVGSRITTLLIDMTVMAVLVLVLRINDRIAKLIVQVIVFVLNYLFSRFLVFNTRNKTHGINQSKVP